MKYICRGSEVPGDWFEFGHEILDGTERDVFPANRDSRRSAGSNYFRRRCHLCSSTRRYWKRSTDATAKATATHRIHAHNMVKWKLAPDVQTAVTMMNASGLTVHWLAQSALQSIGKRCPGRCFTPRVVDGKPVCEDHVIHEWNDLWLDWHDPEYPISPENAGWLCPSCQKQKGRMGWAKFMARQHAIRMNFLRGRRLGPPPVQLSLLEGFA